MFRLEHPETVMVSVFGNQKTVTVWLSHMEHKFSEHTVTVSEGKSVDAFNHLSRMEFPTPINWTGPFTFKGNWVVFLTLIKF